MATGQLGRGLASGFSLSILTANHGQSFYYELLYLKALLLDRDPGVGLIPL